MNRCIQFISIIIILAKRAAAAATAEKELALAMNGLYTSYMFKT